MAGFYHDSQRRVLFHEHVIRSGPFNGPENCEVGVVEWSPGDPPRTGNIVETDARALLLRVRPRVRIVMAPLDLAYYANGSGIEALFDHFAVPSDFVSQRLEGVTHSFSAVRDGSNYYSFFHFLCKNVTVNGPDGPSPGIADPRGAEVSQGDWTWIRTSIFLRWDNCDDKDKATVTLLIFSASSEMRDRCQRLWETDLSNVLIDPFALFVICLDELWLQAQGIVRTLSAEFSKVERTALDLAESSQNRNSNRRHDFVGLHNIAKHIMFLKEGAEAASKTLSHLETFHKGLRENPPQRHDALHTMQMTGQMLAQKSVQFEVWNLRMASLQQRMQNIINLSFNTVTQHDSHLLKDDSKSMRAVATVTMVFLPAATIATIFGSEFFSFNDKKQNISVAQNFWIFWALTGPLSLGVWFLYYYLCYFRKSRSRPRTRMNAPELHHIKSLGP